jgi:hypothetical protein
MVSSDKLKKNTQLAKLLIAVESDYLKPTQRRIELGESKLKDNLLNSWGKTSLMLLKDQHKLISRLCYQVDILIHENYDIIDALVEMDNERLTKYIEKYG